MFQKKRTRLLLALVVAAAVVLMAVAYLLLTPKGAQGEKLFTFLALDAAGDTLWEGQLRTGAAYVGEVLSREGLIDGDRSGLGLFVTTVAGVEADVSRQQWWCLYVNNEMAMTAVDATPLADGDHVLFLLMEGY